MSCALVTTCFNEIASVRVWQDNVQAQTRQPEEISIVDAGSTDGTREFLEAWASRDPRLRLEIWPRCNVAQGRNRAISNIEAKIIVSTDMGCRLDSRWFEKLCEPLDKDPAVQVVAGNYAADESTITTAAARAALYVNDGYHPRLVPGFLPSSRSIAYRRSVWEKLNGYPEDMTLAGDDTVYALQIQKAGYKTAYAPDAICFWGRHTTLRGYWKEAFVYGRGSGEADLPSPKFFSVEYPGYSRLLSHAHALYRATGKSLPAYFTAFKKLDWSAMFLILPLQYGIAINIYSGYIVGASRGIIHCRACRERLTKDELVSQK